jgi:hypothetical protein
VVDARLDALDRGEVVRLGELERREWAFAEGEHVINAGIATSASASTSGQLFLGDPSLRLDEIEVATSAITMRNLTFSFFAQSTAPAVDTTAAVPRPQLGRVPIVVRAAQARLEAGSLLMRDVVLTAGGVASESASFTYVVGGATDHEAERAHNVTLGVPFTLMHNTSSPHALAAFLGELTKARWRQVHGISSPAEAAHHNDEQQPGYAVYNHPLPLTARQELRVKLVLGVLSALFVLIPCCYIPASAAVFVVKERAVKSKHLQLVSGAGPAAYWLAAYLWDIVMYALTATGCMGVFLWFDEPGYVGDAEQTMATALVLCAFGVAVLPAVYCWSFLFESHTTAQIGTLLFNITTGFAAVIAHVVMAVTPDAQRLDTRLLPLYRCFPQYVLGETLLGTRAQGSHENCML